MKRTIIVTFCLLYGSVCQGQLNEPVVHGFVSQGVIQAKDSNYINHDGEPSLRLTEIGVNMSMRLHDRVRVAGQGIYLNGGNRYPEGVRIDYLFLDWQLASGLDWQMNVQVGRVKNYHWLFSATRDVPHTRPSIILPQSVYFDSFRDISLGSDGAALLANADTAAGSLEWHWSYGTSPISDEQSENLFSNLATGEIKQTKDHQMSLVFKPIGTSMELGLSGVNAAFDYHQGPQDRVFSGSATSKRLMLRFRYSSENWELSSELLREWVAYYGVFGPGGDIHQASEGGYLQWRYFLSPELTLLARADLFDLNRKDRSGQLRFEQTQGAVPRYFGYMDDVTLGVSWNIAPQWRAQFEYHRVKGAGRLAPVILPDTVHNDQEYWDLFAVQIMYWF
ncbi:TonB-dependent receptor [Fluctibacter halophilus]|nr:TonB-dependent receptor [Aestuariibacter halophilus]